jgi:protein TonB
MKKLIFIIAIFAATISTAQEEWGDVDKNKLTMKEIAPVWPGCKGSVSQRDACFNTKLTQHIVKNFKYPAEEYKKNIQGRVTVNLTINKQGTVEVRSVTGGNPGLQKAARDNIMKIPKMKPGMMGGKPRAIKMTVPFTFKTGK